MDDKTKLTCWSDIRDGLMSPQEQAECQNWLNELGKLMDARDTGKIDVNEYCRLCFELDKKYGIADDEDAELYLNDEEDDTADAHAENNFNARFAFVGF